jgi:hypothetical protein
MPDAPDGSCRAKPKASDNSIAVKGLSALVALGLALTIAVMLAPTAGANVNVHQEARSSASICPWTVESLVSALDAIDERLDSGVSYYSYGKLLRHATFAFRRISKRTFRPACTKRVALPALRGLNAYIDAYNSWSKCRAWYYSAKIQNDVEWGISHPSCESPQGPGDGYRQRKWNIAHVNVTRAVEALG